VQAANLVAELATILTVGGRVEFQIRVTAAYQIPPGKGYAPGDDLFGAELDRFLQLNSTD
jgi:hypothetical protein